MNEERHQAIWLAVGLQSIVPRQYLAFKHWNIFHTIKLVAFYPSPEKYYLLNYHNLLSVA